MLDDTIHSRSTVAQEGVSQQGRELLVSWESLHSTDSWPSHLLLHRSPHRSPLSING
jgi:hypothetical protein